MLEGLVAEERGLYGGRVSGLVVRGHGVVIEKQYSDQDIRTVEYRHRVEKPRILEENGGRG